MTEELLRHLGHACFAIAGILVVWWATSLPGVARELIFFGSYLYLMVHISGAKIELTHSVRDGEAWPVTEIFWLTPWYQGGDSRRRREIEFRDALQARLLEHVGLVCQVERPLPTGTRVDLSFDYRGWRWYVSLKAIEKNANQHRLTLQGELGDILEFAIEHKVRKVRILWVLGMTDAERAAPHVEHLARNTAAAAYFRAKNKNLQVELDYVLQEYQAPPRT